MNDLLTVFAADLVARLGLSGFTLAWTLLLAGSLGTVACSLTFRLTAVAHCITLGPLAPT